MIPLRSDVTTAVLYHLGDTQASGGTIFTSAFQAPHLNMAYQEMFSKLDLMGADRIQREGYFLLPAYTGMLYPSVAGLTNFGGPAMIRERGTATGYAISAMTPNATAGTCAATVAALPASVVTGAQGEVYGVVGVSDDVNDRWMLTVNSTTSIVLNGCAATGAYVSGGTLVYSTETWSDPLIPRDDTNDFATAAGSSLGLFCWQRGVLRFPPASTARELKLTYRLSSSLPVVASPVAGDSMGVDDCLNYLAARTAQYCRASKVGGPRVQELQQQADYHLGLILSNATRQQQNEEPIVMSPFRRRRDNLFWAG